MLSDATQHPLEHGPNGAEPYQILLEAYDLSLSTASGSACKTIPQSRNPRMETQNLDCRDRNRGKFMLCLLSRLSRCERVCVWLGWEHVGANTRVAPTRQMSFPSRPKFSIESAAQHFQRGMFEDGSFSKVR